MTQRKRRRTKLWSKIVEERGIQVRIFERERGKLYRSIVLNGRKHRKSLGHRNRALAEEQAREFARTLAAMELTGYRGHPTLGQVFRQYEQHRMPLLSARRRQWAKSRIPMFESAWGSELRMSDLSQTHVDTYCTQRRSGVLFPPWKGRDAGGVRDGTLDGDFRWLSSCFSWAHSHKVNGQRLLPENPLKELLRPKERNVRRPVASRERYVKTMDKVDLVDPTGRLACMLALARFTARRIDAICQLRAPDVLLTREQVTAALAADGRDEALAEFMPNGAIRWRADTDKMGFSEITPLGQAARAAVESYLRQSMRMGDVPLFPSDLDPALPMRRDVASRWLLKAEKLARLPKLAGGIWHPYRRLWASERKDLPDKDVAAVGGWRDTRAMKLNYQQTDAETMLRVVEAAG